MLQNFLCRLWCNMTFICTESRMFVVPKLKRKEYLAKKHCSLNGIFRIWDMVQMCKQTSIWWFQSEDLIEFEHWNRISYPSYAHRRYSNMGSQFHSFVCLLVCLFVCLLDHPLVEQWVGKAAAHFFNRIPCQDKTNIGCPRDSLSLGCQ